MSDETTQINEATVPEVGAETKDKPRYTRLSLDITRYLRAQCFDVLPFAVKEQHA